MLRIFRHSRHPRVRVPVPRIRQPSPYRGFLVLTGAVILLGALGYTAFSAYEFGTREAGFDRAQARALRGALKEKLAEVEDERDELQQQVATLTRTVQIDQEAVRQVRASLVELQNERLELREEVAFVSSLLSDGKTKAGLRARNFVLEPLENPREYRFRFTLSKFPQTDETISATLSLSVTGRMAGEEEVVDLEKILLGDSPSKLEFKQIMQVERALALPAGFVPERLTVVVNPREKDVLGLEETIAWRVEP
jgi:hypothetical protein